ncbi:Eukaryotic aspartyl protease family protein [Perilla frutescens var. hirtella]|uniref:Eukaryotic aspartyl protease family protein n=1 Tax=Perilla frutescens var. hirtella TaxID=608512 RepID=A0AAD4JDR8_PERFH|nr:Eukaryotic aspartyl protease family protein [Perilla frutescens var. hirtella]
MASAFLIICSLLLSSICFAASNNGGFTVDLIHRDSLKSPSNDPSNTRFQRIRSAFDRSFSRKSSLLSSLSTSLQDSIAAPITSAGGEYVMKIMIGTPPVEQLGIADTGSDLLWTQCNPCKQCYNQTLPLFDPSKSSSYRTVSCNSDQCAAAGTSSCGDDNRCQYEVAYGDSSHSNGDLAVETLTFDGGVSFPKVAFGCGHDNEGTFSQTGSGIIGLGGGSISIINQLQNTIGGKFSYCLTSLNSNVSSKISFGSSAVVAGPNVVSTPLVNKSPATFYYLTLEGMSVGTERVDYYKSSGGAVEEAAVDEGNIIIDSGTTLTFVPSEIYEGVEAALVKAISATRVSDPQGAFGLCYRIEGGGGLKSPPITAHFKGADLVLPEASSFVEVEEGTVCLTVVQSEDLAIFGNLHQINYHVGYDRVNQQVSFLPTDCSNIQ